MAVDKRRTRFAALAATLAGACASVPYAPCPVGLAGLPPDAFARCLDVLQQRYGPLVVADAGAFRLQSGWQASVDPPGERRATVFRDGGADLAVVVELRWLSLPVVGLPGWTEPRGDAAAERELAAALRVALAPAVNAPIR